MNGLYLVVSDTTIVENCIFKPFSFPHPTYASNRNLLNTFGRELWSNQPRIIPVKLSQNPVSDFRGEVLVKLLTDGRMAVSIKRNDNRFVHKLLGMRRYGHHTIRYVSIRKRPIWLFTIRYDTDSCKNSFFSQYSHSFIYYHQRWT